MPTYRYRPDHNGECLNCDEPLDAHGPAPDYTCPPSSWAGDALGQLGAQIRQLQHDVCDLRRDLRFTLLLTGLTFLGVLALLLYFSGVI